MAKYRKRPIVVEAFQWDGRFNEETAPDWFDNAVKTGIAELWTRHDGKCDLVIKTLEGKHTASFGDYIIKGVQGEIYPCKPDIFQQTYEAV